MTKQKRRGRFIAACLAPALILFFLIMVIPTINIFWMSLLRWGGLSDNKEFIGLENFKILFNDPNFYTSMQNTILIIVVVTIITMVLSILFAAILSREKVKGQNLFRIVFYIPNILSVVVISAIFSAIYEPNQGLLNNAFGAVGLDGLKQMWLGFPTIAIYSLIGAMIWQAIGYYMVMYMASMSSIPENLYEAAALEGAGKVKQFFMITLPLIWNNIRTTLTFFIVSTINLSFLFVKVLTSGGPGGSTEVALSYMYKQSYTNSSYGYGMAIGVVVFIFSFALAGILNFITKREVYEF